jgi:hypothetical protein
MNKILANVNVGRKNIVFGIALFMVMGFMAGMPLTVDLFGGSMLTPIQYQSWKVLHAYGVFVAFINFFFGFLVDKLSIDRRQMEIASWSFLIAGLVGGFGRPVLLLLSVTGGWAGYIIDLVETVGFVLGTYIFVRSRMHEHEAEQAIETSPVRI